MDPPERARGRPGPASRPAPRRSPLDPQWLPERVPGLAHEAGLCCLGDLHWRVILTCREETARTGRIPTLEQLAALSRLDSAVLRALFPGDVVGVAARLAGIVCETPPPRPGAARARSPRHDA